MPFDRTAHCQRIGAHGGRTTTEDDTVRVGLTRRLVLPETYP